MLEHFDRAGAVKFLADCHAVLRPGGIVRVVVPDLQAIASAYLAALDRADSGLAGWDANYDWMVLELLDQMVRTESGGEAKKYLESDSLSNRDFILQRWGLEASRILEQLAAQKKAPLSNRPRWKKPLIQRLRESALRLILRDEYSLLQSARFRDRGEIHKWMYDHYSLSRLLASVGFEQVVRRDPASSYLANWASWHLDTCEDGSTYKPDSLYVEAIKPA